MQSNLTKSQIQKLSTNPIEKLKLLSVDQIVNILQQAQSTYYNTGKPLIDDNIYDIIKDFLKKKDPKNPILKFVGANISEDDKRKEELPVWMGSMDKIKPDPKVVDTFKSKYPGSYLVSDKLDGNSALLMVDQGKSKLFTRGNGKVGQNISHLIPFIQGIPGTGTLPSCLIRGELIISKKNWEKISHENTNARNTVAGVVNAKIPNLDLAKRIQFVAYSLIEPEMELDKQMKWLKKNKFIPVASHLIRNQNTLNVEWLSNWLTTRRQESEYEIDGIIVSHNSYHKIQSGKNPTYAFAFKNLLTQDTAEVIVTNVEWNVSKDGLIKPTVIFEPVKLSGVTIRRATGFNGDFIESNVIGPGSTLVIKRSGDVIPHIIKSINPASSGAAQMPSIPWEWTEGHKDIKTKGATSDQDVKMLIHFFETLDIKGLASGTIKRAYEAGYTSVNDILNLKADNSIIRPQLLADTLKKVKESSCLKIMNASNAFGTGFGERKLSSIISALPEMHLDDPKSKHIPTVKQLCEINGVSNITANKFIKGLQTYRKFMGNTIHVNKCQAVKDVVHVEGKNNKWSNKFVVFTGFRNKEWEEQIKNQGGVVETSITSKTNLLVAKDTTNLTGKLQKAVEKKIPIISIEEMEKKIHA